MWWPNKSILLNGNIISKNNAMFIQNVFQFFKLIFGVKIQMKITKNIFIWIFKFIFGTKILVKITKNIFIWIFKIIFLR